MINLEKKTETGNVGNFSKNLDYAEIETTGDATHYFNLAAKAFGVPTWGNTRHIKRVKRINSEDYFEIASED